MEYINYTRNMGFEQDPDYDYLRNLFREVMTANNYANDYEFDWTLKTQPNRDSHTLNKEPLNNPGYVNTNTAVMPTLPDKKKSFLNTQTQENEKIGENGFITNSNLYIQTNTNVHNTTNEVNKPSKFQVNQTNYKFIDSINNNNDRNNTAAAHLNTIVHFNDNGKNNNSKMQSSFNKSL